VRSRNDKTGQWFSPGPPVSSTNKADRHDMTEILLRHHQTNKHPHDNHWPDLICITIAQNVKTFRFLKDTKVMLYITT
jgi:hypothetical protein